MSQSLFMEEKLLDAFKANYKKNYGEISKYLDLITIDFNKEDVLSIIDLFKNHPELSFNLLVDETAVDYLEYPQPMPERFGLVYILYSFKNDFRIKLRTFVSEKKPEIESICVHYEAANWLEREIYDMYGIQFLNHPELKRILMPDYYEGHPLRKDYPLKGRGERSNFPKYKEQPWDNNKEISKEE